MNGTKMATEKDKARVKNALIVKIAMTWGALLGLYENEGDEELVNAMANYNEFQLFDMLDKWAEELTAEQANSPEKFVDFVFGKACQMKQANAK